MYRQLFAQPHIGSYSVCLVLGLLFGYLITRWRAKRVGIKGPHIDNLILLIALLSLFGARLFSWFFYFPPGANFWKAMVAPGGGMVFYGGLIFGIATVIGYACVARLPLGNLLDACAPGVALGLAVGRIGCFMAGCCWGDVCLAPAQVAKLPSSDIVWQVRTVPALSSTAFPLAVEFPQNTAAYRQHKALGLIHDYDKKSMPVHPVQLYEAGLAFLLCIGLHLWFRHRRWVGQIAVGLSIGYAGIRFATEFLRADNSPQYFGLTLSQVISVIIAGAAFAFLLYRHSRGATGIPARVPITAEVR